MENGSKTFGSEDLNQLDQSFKRNFINSLSGYKSVNLIGSIDNKGKTNLAIFNTVIHVGSTPPLMGFLIRPPVVPRHTLNNIEETGSFTINHITPTFYHKAHQTAARYGHDEKSEFDIVGLNAEFSKTIPAPYVAESQVKIGLKFREKLEVKSNNTLLIVGEIVEITLPEKALLSDGLIDLGVTGTVTSSGLDTYYTTRKIARLSFANPDSDLQIIG